MDRHLLTGRNQHSFCSDQCVSRSKLVSSCLYFALDSSEASSRGRVPIAIFATVAASVTQQGKRSEGEQLKSCPCFNWSQRLRYKHWSNPSSWQNHVYSPLLLAHYDPPIVLLLCAITIFPYCRKCWSSMCWLVCIALEECEMCSCIIRYATQHEAGNTSTSSDRTSNRPLASPGWKIPCFINRDMVPYSFKENTLFIRM